MGEIVIFSDYGKTLVSNFIEMFLKFGILALLLTVNFTAVAIALNCNKNESFGVKIFASAYAFLFGIIYILVNYYSYRIMLKKSPYVFEGKVFPF